MPVGDCMLRGTWPFAPAGWLAPAREIAAFLISSGHLRASLRSLLLLAACAVITLAVRDYLGSRSAAPAVEPEFLPVLPEDLGAQAQGWQWTQSAGDSTRIQARADGLVQGADGRRTDLRNAVLTIFHEESGSRDRVESAAMRLLDGGGLYSDGETVMTLGIADSRAAPSAVITTSGVTFLTAGNRARTDRPVRYDFEEWEGSSLGAIFDAGTGELRMLADVRLGSRAGTSAQAPAEITAETLHYSEQGARIDLAGGATVRQGGRRIDCSEATLWIVDGRIERIDGAAVRGTETVGGRTSRFATPRLEVEFGEHGELLEVRGRGVTRFTSDESGQGISVRGEIVDMHYEPGPVEGRSYIRTVEARGSASAGFEAAGEGSASTIRSEHLRLTLRPGSAGIESVETLQRGALEQARSDSAGPAQTLEGDRIEIRFGDGSVVERLLAKGDARLVQSAGGPDDRSLRTSSASLEAAFDPGTSDIAGILQQGDFRFEEIPAGGAAARRGSADRARFGPDTSLLTLEGSAIVSDGQNSISARRVVVHRETGRLEARGGATASMAAHPGATAEAAPNGLFAGPEPVYASADLLVSESGNQTVEARGAARVWQGANRIDADAIFLGGQSSGLHASGSVMAIWADADAARDGRPGSVAVRSEQMRYDEAGEAVFEGGVDFRRAGMRVLSDRLRTTHGSGSDGEPGRAFASGDVRIAQFADGTGVRGFGERAEFRLAESEIVLTGSPARVVAPDGTESSGGSLTFRVADDSLLVSGRGAERAYTYHPASR